MSKIKIKIKISRKMGKGKKKVNILRYLEAMRLLGLGHSYEELVKMNNDFLTKHWVVCSECNSVAVSLFHKEVGKAGKRTLCGKAAVCVYRTKLSDGREIRSFRNGSNLPVNDKDWVFGDWNGGMSKFSDHVKACKRFRFFMKKK